MKFNIQNRIILLGLLPVTGDITSLKQIRVIREELAFTDAENKELMLTTNPANGSVNWNPKHKVKHKEIKISPVMLDVIRAILNDKNEKKELHDNMIDLWDLFAKL